MIGFIAAAVLTASSQISDVTVYNDRAQVVRTARVEAAQGINTVVFEDLPRAIDSRGIQVDGSGAATVLDVRFKTENLEGIADEAWTALYEHRDALKENEKQILQRIKRLKDAKEFLSKIGEKVTHPSSEESGLALDPEKWAKMLELQAGRGAEYDRQILAADQDLKEVQEDLAKVEADLRDAGAEKRRQRRIVEVDLEAAKPGPVELKLSYLVHGPGWLPTYDIRADSRTRRMEVNYFALVRQNTGEDWSHVALKLSTAQPGLGGQHPELEPWRINVQSDAIPAASGYSLDYSVETGQRTAPVVRALAWAPALLAGDAEQQPVASRTTEASVQGTAVLFAVDGTCDIGSDHVEHRVAVSSLAMKAHFRYSCVPKLDKYVYLKAKGKNEADYPLLAGNANIYLDGSYVATSPLELVSPGEDFWAFLGADESMKVEYNLINKQESREGLTGRTERHSYEYLFTVKNTHATPEELIIFDQLPISGNEDVKVELDRPRFSGNSDALEINDEKRIKWFLVLKPGEERDVPFAFHVDGPKDKEIGGLK